MDVCVRGSRCGGGCWCREKAGSELSTLYSQEKSSRLNLRSPANFLLSCQLFISRCWLNCALFYYTPTNEFLRSCNSRVGIKCSYLSNVFLTFISFYVFWYVLQFFCIVHIWYFGHHVKASKSITFFLYQIIKDFLKIMTDAGKDVRNWRLFHIHSLFYFYLLSTYSSYIFLVGVWISIDTLGSKRNICQTS